MTIGQALAMMRSAEQFKDYQNQLNAQPAIDWRDVTQQAATAPQASAAMYAPMPPMEPEAYPQEEMLVGPPDQYAVESPVAGEPYVAEPVPPPAPFDYAAVTAEASPSRISPADQFAAYQERTGALGPDLFSRDFYEPQTDYATMPTSQPAAFAQYPFPSEDVARTPLPMPGASRPSNVVDFRAPMGQTDVPMEEPILPGSDLAMLEQPTEEQPVVGKTGKVEPPKPAWTPGQKFDTTLKFGEKQYPATVTKYAPAEDDGRKYPAKVTLDLGGGKTRTMDISPDDPNYKAIESQYQGLVDKGGQELQYTAKVKIGNEFLPARYDPVSRQLKYLDASLEDPTQKAEFVYAEKPISKLTPEEFIGSIDAEGKPDTKELERIKRESPRAVSARIEGTVPRLVRGWRGPDSREDIRDRLVGKLTTTEKDPVGTISWSYDVYDKEGNFIEQVPLKEAIERGIVPKRVADNLQKEWNTAVGTYEGYMKSAEAAQGIESPTARDRNVSGIKKNIDDLTEQIKQLDADYADGKITLEQRDDLKDRAQTALDKERSDLIDAMSATPGIINTGGGTVGYEAPPSEIGSSVIPRSVLGLRALLAGGPSVQPANVAPGEVTPFTDAQIVENLKTRALESIKTRSLKDDPNFARAMVGWQNRMLDMQDYLARIADEQNTTVDEILSRQAKFTYYAEILISSGGEIDEATGGVIESKTMPVDTAIDEFLGSIQNLRTVLGSGDEMEIADAREKFEAMSKMFSGNIKIRGVDVDSNEAESIFVGNDRDLPLLGARNFFDIDKQMNMPVVRDEQFAPVSVERRAPESSVTRTPSGAGPRTASPTTQAFPLTSIPGLPPNQRWRLVDGNFSLATQIPLDANTYAAFSMNYGQQQVGATTRKALAAISFDDSNASVDPAIESETKATIQKINQKFVDPASQAMRRAYANTWHQMIEKTGFDIYHGLGTLEADLDALEAKARSLANSSGLSDAQKESQINAELEKFMQKFYGVDPRETNRANKSVARATTDNLLNNRASGAMVKNLAALPNGDQYKSGLGNTTRLMDNVEQSAYELALLFVAAGFGKTGYQHPQDNAVVTWLINPADTSVLSGQRSALTIPGSMEGDVSNNIDFTTAPRLNSNKAAGGPPPAAAQDIGTDPAYASALYNTDQILATSDFQNLRNMVNPLVSGIANKSQAAYNRRGTNLFSGSGDRPADNNNTRWGVDSDNAVKRYWTETMFAGNIYAKLRHRKVFGSGGSLPGFKISRMK